MIPHVIPMSNLPVAAVIRTGLSQNDRIYIIAEHLESGLLSFHHRKDDGYSFLSHGRPRLDCVGCFEGFSWGYSGVMGGSFVLIFWFIKAFLNQTN